MARHSMFREVPSEPTPTPEHGLQLPQAESNLQTYLVDLASRFSAQSGGGLSSELSADLALQVVLNEIAEQACLATGATGAAIALWREGEMVCRATSGSTAPELGSRLNTSSGLSGECFQTHCVQRCDDVTSDPRADLDASTRLGVHSMMVIPLQSGSDLIGLFAAFSPRVAAFADRDQLTLETLAQRVLQSIERAVTLGTAATPDGSPLSLSEGSADLSQAEAQGSTEPGRAIGVITWIGALTIVVGATWMGARVAQHLGWRTADIAHSPSALPVTQHVLTPQNVVPAGPLSNGSKSGSTVAGTSGRAAPSSATPSKSGQTSGRAAQPAAGGLLIYENGREVFRMVPSTDHADANANPKAGPLGSAQADVLPPAGSAEPAQGVDVSPMSDRAILLKSVAPEYPESARQRQIHGAVVLEVRIAQDGSVLGVERISGDPLLAQAAADAVKQWRFKPFLVDGHVAETQTRVTLNFKLPQ